MKRYISGIMLGILLLALFAVPAYAYDTPVQGTDNATDVILWPATTANISVTSANVSIDGFVDSNEAIADSYLAFLMVVFLVAIIIKLGGPVPYAIGTGVCWVYGFRTAADQTVMSPLWVASTAVGVFGLYFLYSIIRNAFSRKKDKT